MHKSNNTFSILYGNRQFVKWKIWGKCGLSLEKSGRKWNYKMFLKMSKFVALYNF